MASGADRKQKVGIDLQVHLANIAKISIQYLNIAMYDLKSDQFIVMFINLTYKEKGCIAPVYDLGFGIPHLITFVATESLNYAPSCLYIPGNCTCGGVYSMQAFCEAELALLGYEQDIVDHSVTSIAANQEIPRGK